jgi:hypothetical protein
MKSDLPPGDAIRIRAVPQGGKSDFFAACRRLRLLTTAH